MRVMVLVKATAESEAGAMPPADLLEAMTRYNEALSEAGLLRGGEGLHPSARAKRVRFEGGERTVADGPFPEGEQLVSGFWIWEVASIEEAVDRARRCPMRRGEVELRPIVEAADFGEAMTPELREREERLREATERRSAGVRPRRGDAPRCTATALTGEGPIRRPGPPPLRPARRPQPRLF